MNYSRVAEQNGERMKPVTFAAALSLLCVAAPVLAQPTTTYRWSGQCKRASKVANANLTLHWANSRPVDGELNNRGISGISYEAKNGVSHISFNTPGIFQDQNIIRQFRGTFQHSDWSLQGTLSQDDGKFATCTLSYNN